MRNLAGSVPKELLENGLLGRGIIVSIQQTSVSTGADFDPAHVCVFTVEVALDSVPRYTATCRQAALRIASRALSSSRDSCSRVTPRLLRPPASGDTPEAVLMNLA